MSTKRNHRLIAITGMAGRFPGARNVGQLWANICAGVESVKSLSEAELLQAGTTKETLANPSHVPVSAAADDLDRFDAGFFSVNAREAEMMDPQLRLGLESVWEALEDAGIDPSRVQSTIGLFMGASLSSYLCRNLLPNIDLLERIGAERLLILNDKDFYPTTISYRLNLRGPSISVGTACSSSLVAVHLACQSLIANECDTAIAGGSSVHVPLGQGYFHTKDGIYSPDGHCRPFDAEARGTVGADGAAFVVLKRYEDAVRSHDRIYALISGTAVNNDGSAKAGYTAPSVTAQSAVIQEALQRAEISARDIGYVEAHGTGTILGDPVEVTALNETFKKHTADTAYCALGSLKANVGHLDTAAGAAGLIKAACAVFYGAIPPAINFSTLNPHIDLSGSPFFVNTKCRAWSQKPQPRRAGVSAFGVGGTNVHVILEEAAVPSRQKVSGPWIFPVSARNESALQTAVSRLANALDENHQFADVEFTLGAGRKHFPVRRAFVVDSREDIKPLLTGNDGQPAAAISRLFFFAPPAHALPGNFGSELFASHPEFRTAIIECLELLDHRECAAEVQNSFRVDAGDGCSALSTAARTLRAFITEYALGQMLMEWGVKPSQIVGLEAGEIVANVLSGALNLASAISAAYRLGMGSPANRAMIVKLSERDLIAMLPRDVSIQAVCAPEACVISGPEATLTSLRPVLLRSGVPCKWLEYQIPNGGQAHSRIRLNEIFGNTKGECDLWLELGPGQMLTGLLRRNRLARTALLPGVTLREHRSESHCVLQWLATLWEHGLDVNWDAFLKHRGGQVCSLPTYPFQSERYWVDPPRTAEISAESSPNGFSIALTRLEQIAQQRQGPPRYMPSDLRRELDTFAIRVICEYLLAHGILEESTWKFGSLCEHLNVLPQFHRCLRYWIGVLEQEGLATGREDEVHFTNFNHAAFSVAEHCNRLRERFAEFRGLVDFLEYCGDHFPDSLSTRHAGLQALYPDGGDTLIRKSVEDTVGHGTLPLCVEILCRWVAEEWQPARKGKARILEIGMGGGILTWNLAPLLGNTGVEYVGTDITRAMLAGAEQRALQEKISWMTFQQYDLRRSPLEQGFRPASFDLILGLDVVHVVPQAAQALKHLRGLLAPGGVLGIIESNSQDSWPNLIWGLTEEWWTFEDRDKTPLMPPQWWKSELESAGFTEVTVGPTNRHQETDCALLLCKTSEGEASPAKKATSMMQLVPKRDDLDTWFYTPVWREWLVGETKPLPSQRWLFFANDELNARLISQALREAGYEVVIARQHSVYVRLGSRDYRIRVDSPADYDTLIQSVLREGSLYGILHAWTLGLQPSSNIDDLDAEQNAGIYSILFTMQALGRVNFTTPLRLGILSNNTAEVTGGDLLQPLQATLKGAAKIIPQEYPNVRCVHLDLDARAPLSKDDVQNIVTILQGDMQERLVAYREHRVFRLDFDQVQGPQAQTSLSIQEHGVYLITGGLGGVGLTLAEYLAKEAKAKLVLIGRTGMPPRKDWSRIATQDGSVANQIRLIERLEALGSEVLILTADLADGQRMQQVVNEAEEKFGPIQGVIHTAAVADVAGVIQRRSRSATERAMAAKVKGTLVLDALLQSRRLDFFVLCSALGATIYNLKFGEVGYVAANDFLNAYSHYLRNTRGVPAITISWTDWEEVGMAADALKRLGQAREDFDVVEHPFWEQRRSIESRVRFSAAVHSGAQWLFYGHRIAGRPTLPGTGIIELIASAFCLQEQTPACEIRNLYVLSPVAADEWSRPELSVTFEQSGDSSQCELGLTQQDGHQSQHASGWIRTLDPGLRPLALSIAAIQTRCSQRMSFAEGEWQRGAQAIQLDRRWDSIRDVWLGESEGLARLELSADSVSELHGFAWHPALMDSALAFLNHAVLKEDDTAYLPIGYERVRLWAPLEPVIYSHGRWQINTDSHGKSLRFDFTIVDFSGRVLVEINGLTARSVTAAAQPRPELQSNYLLEIGRPGFLNTLGFRKVLESEPPPGYVEIEVIAAGLNFKEVLSGLGLMGVDPSFGMECSGKVRRVGAGVTRLKSGDNVVTFGSRWMMPSVHVPEAWVQPMPELLGFEEAATTPVAFMVAYHALRNLARLQPGESVLIHSACGGVGLAAVQIAQFLGAKILATAGSDAKRNYLRESGLQYVSDSRSAAFLADTVAWTGGMGVNVVLNSLGGELLDTGLKALAPRGRFVELGRRDLQENRQIGMQLFAKGVQFLPVIPDPQDLEFLSAWDHVCDLLRSGKLKPLPYQVFGASRIADAFEQMSRGEHIGKFIISPDSKYPPVPRDIKIRQTGEADEVIRSLVQGMTRTEGVHAFQRALASGLPEVLVSTQDLKAMLQQQEIVSSGGHEAFWASRKNAPEVPAAVTGQTVSVNPRTYQDTEIEVGLAAIWRDLLGVDDIGPDADFFDLGGDSLVAIRMIARMKEVFDVEQSLAGMFELSTFSKMSDSIKTARTRLIAVQS